MPEYFCFNKCCKAGTPEGRCFEVLLNLEAGEVQRLGTVLLEARTILIDLVVPDLCHQVQLHDRGDLRKLFRVGVRI